MNLTAEQLRLIKIGYINYRLLKNKSLGAKVPSAEMRAAINALDSKLATRGRIKAKVPSKLIVAMAKQEKHIHDGENAEKGRTALKAFLEASGVPGSHPVANALRDELELLAYFVCETYPQVKWIPGPLKVVDKAMGKTITDYDYAWGSNKDLVRGTVACGSQDDLQKVAGLIKQTCMASNLGMYLLKQDDQKSVRDLGGSSVAGYSGWNFVIQFRDHPLFGAEVQANTYDMMYGKMSKAKFCSDMLVSAAGYAEYRNRLRFPGGLGHALYDIQDDRSEATPAEKKLARELSLDYNDAARGVFRMGSSLISLNARILAFCTKLTSVYAKTQWQKAVSGCEPGSWMELSKAVNEMSKNMPRKFEVATPARPII